MRQRIPRYLALGVSFCSIGLTSAAWAVTTSRPLDASASDPAKLDWMVGSPPPPNRTIRVKDGSFVHFPAIRWSFSNFRQLLPTVNVSRGIDAPVPLPRALRTDDIDAVSFVPIGATNPMTWKDSRAANFTDGIVVTTTVPTWLAAYTARRSISIRKPTC
jgi:hypothetical protein